MARRNIPLINNWLATSAGLPHNNGMHARFLFGPAGSGKTFRCLAEIREELARSPEGPDLILLAPKQATFQLERQLLSDGSVQGYTRLQILSFERLAAYVFDRVGKPLPELLSEEGRVMVLRAILEERHAGLRVFRASARLSGFARQLSKLLREFQRFRLDPETLGKLAGKPGLSPQVADKLSDLALILRAYLEWVGGRQGSQVEDGSRLLDIATAALGDPGQALGIGGLWLDGFAEMTPQEQALLAAVVPHCDQATLAFCLPATPTEEEAWLSPWAVVSDTAGECLLGVGNLAGVETEIEILKRDVERSRFGGSPTLARLEQAMAARGAAVEPTNIQPRSGDDGGAVAVEELSPASVRLVECSNVEAEAMLAAREILQFVRAGGRYRDCAVLVRDLERYQDVLRRMLARYDIPSFLDRREPVSHHPLAELTRFAVRTVAYDWRLDDWLGVLKTGLTRLNDYEVDRLENAALSRGWEGTGFWLKPLPIDDDLNGGVWLEEKRACVTQPFLELSQSLHSTEWRPTGDALAKMVRLLWDRLSVEGRLEEWGGSSPGKAVHGTVWEQMNDWLDNLERAFGDVALPLREWLQIIEAGLSGLSVGMIPPALDQVLVGSVDRSRNPDLRFALVLGVNESVFPAAPPPVPLLSEADQEHLEMLGVRIGPGRRQFGHERYLGYIALTRARERVLVSWSATDSKRRAQNRSRFVDELKRTFPEIAVENFDGNVQWQDSQHSGELAGALLLDPVPVELQPLLALPSVQSSVERWRRVTAALKVGNLSAEVVAGLYGDTLNLSVSALEAFASCPFRFFTAYGLRARERDEFQVDVRQTGSFQHEVLAAFHLRVMGSGKRWREVDPEQAKAWLREIGEAHLKSFQHGMMRVDASREFHARALLRNLDRLVEQMTVWARQNEFEPEAVEVSFGLEEDDWPAWTLDLGDGRTVKVRGRVDRVDLLPLETGSVAVAILDYKSGGKKFEPLKFENGLELQMLAYLNAICANNGAKKAFGAEQLQPAGVFYVGLRAKPEPGRSRADAEASGEVATAAAFQHLGRFDAALVRKFDTSQAPKGAQFRYSFKNNGEPAKRGNDALPEAEFEALLTGTSQQIRGLAGRIFDGNAAVSPYEHGSNETACGICEFRPICRFDAWAQPYRSLKRTASRTEGREGSE